MSSPPYIGRFAPSPTGPLHFGSLVAAVGSYCDARAAAGKWLLRIEDIDPPREVPGATTHILQQLDAYGLEWDGDVLYQHTRLAAYQVALEQLQQQNHVFWCSCSRKDLGALQHYPGTCRRQTHPVPNAAVRVRSPEGCIQFHDRVHGLQQEDVAAVIGDFIIQRRDKLFAYQLAVVVDDAFQGITHIVRGADLLDNTARQIALQQLLHAPAPHYLHIPLVTNASGQKLSKQNLAPALPLPAQPTLIVDALAFLGQQPPPDLKHATAGEILAWGVQHWRPDTISSSLHTG